MDSLMLDMQPFPFKARLAFAMMGVINIVLGILLIPKAFSYVVFGFGIVALLIAIFYQRINRPLIYSFDDDGIEGPFGAPKNRKIRWSDIAFIEAKKFSLAIVTSTGDRTQLDSGTFTYGQHMQIKPRILDLAKSKGVDVRVS